MANFEVRTRVDLPSGMIFAELYSDESDLPVAATKPVYRTHQEAMRRIEEMFKAGFGEHGMLVERAPRKTRKEV